MSERTVSDPWVADIVAWATVTAEEDTEVEVISEGKIPLETVRVAGVPSKEACDLAVMDLYDSAEERAALVQFDDDDAEKDAADLREVAAYLRSLHGEKEDP